MQSFSGFTDTMFKEGAISSTHPLKKEPCSSPVLDESVYIPDTRRQADVPSPPDDIGRLSRPASSLVPEKRALKGRVLSLAALPVKDTTSRRSSLELLAASSHAPPPRRSMSGSSNKYSRRSVTGDWISLLALTHPRGEDDQPFEDKTHSPLFRQMLCRRQRRADMCHLSPRAPVSKPPSAGSAPSFVLPRVYASTFCAGFRQVPAAPRVVEETMYVVPDDPFHWAPHRIPLDDKRRKSLLRQPKYEIRQRTRRGVVKKVRVTVCT
eukprot:GEMP01063557.1.p1 GENE.GEMP01063557.1~~GEMP01063557.1.p1  ORF type:complete len:266 (+),score=58.42 GEMP01063557.1:83-880(+)